MISSFSFLYLRSCEGDSVSLCSWLVRSGSCRRRSFLYSDAILSKVSTTFGFSSASMAASDIWFSNSSSSMSLSAADSAGSFSSVSASPAGAGADGGGGRRRSRRCDMRGRCHRAIGGDRGQRLAVGTDGGCQQRRVHVVL